MRCQRRFEGWLTLKAGLYTLVEMRIARFVAALAVAAVGCGGGDPMAAPDGGSVDASPADVDGGAPSPTWSHEFPTVDIDPYGEIAWQCQSWTIGNDEPIYVREVRAENDGAWHHSNWFFVPDSFFDGPDGTWGCSERGFDEVTAGVAGGVLFAQSTQALADVQTFPQGAAVVIPAHSRIVGNIHLLNLESTARSVSIRITMETLPEAAVVTRLVPMSFTNLALAIPPRAESLWAMDCDFSAGPAAPFDFRVYYALPHFHSLGTYFKLEAFGGSAAPTTIVETEPIQGDSWAVTLDPPVDITGATTIRMTCGYDNPRDSVVRYGIGDQEMCVFLAFTDARFKYAGQATASEPAGDVGGVPMQLGNCTPIAFPASP